MTLHERRGMKSIKIVFLVISMHQAVQCDGSEFLFCIMLISADVDRCSIPI